MAKNRATRANHYGEAQSTSDLKEASVISETLNLIDASLARTAELITANEVAFQPALAQDEATADNGEVLDRPKGRSQLHDRLLSILARIQSSNDRLQETNCRSLL
ncbi:hypothetical protein PLUTO_00640 [Luteibacter phage vB_LflM-Pluto]|uniref:Uncharacterized protein n=1 Tax=Luteibacter phage vB_LflM-Pluto TaxID=2948611 RepID=A0A9E7MTS1_9CAUD|nr:hypothetical protein PLUTO_00640 [Luteibacter phage vB_LflM-Pluto]